MALLGDEEAFVLQQPDEDEGRIVTCPPWKRSLKHQREVFGRDGCGSTAFWALKWFLPAACFVCSAVIQMACLHIGTYYYILTMEHGVNVGFQNVTVHNVGKPVDVGSSLFSAGKTVDDVSFGSLQDWWAAQLGFSSVNMKVLDAVSALLPVSWFVLTILSDDLQLWTKLITCNVFLNFFKGLFGFMTVVPDSAGWSRCKERLTDEGVEDIKARGDTTGHDYENSTWRFWRTWGSVWTTFFNFLWFEIVSHVPGTGVKSRRFCADMMYSGHTYFTTLYALGLAELIRMHTRLFPKWARLACLWFIYLFALTEQCVEVYLVLLNRFHYTMDIVMAILLTFLFFTNGSIAIFAKAWVQWAGSKWLGCRKSSNYRTIARKQGDVPQHIKDWANESGHVIVHKGVLRTNGDTWTPVCCVPFCCFWGRHHIIDDDTVQMFGGNEQGSQVYDMSFCAGTDSEDASEDASDESVPYAQGLRFDAAR